MNRRNFIRTTIGALAMLYTTGAPKLFRLDPEAIAVTINAKGLSHGWAGWGPFFISYKGPDGKIKEIWGSLGKGPLSCKNDLIELARLPAGVEILRCCIFPRPMDSLTVDVFDIEFS